MTEWVDKVLKGETVSDCFPLSVPPQKKYAVMLETRLKLLKEDYLPIIEKGFVGQWPSRRVGKYVKDKNEG